ncbi:hypothetical protein JKF63_00833 [Porcisia hertigi]|uniref:Aminopeptidase P1 n=1 Tax=Porcisia hertigi TaxID=2761500 RepID=A0A836HCC8_9TRYP|nr:hypothetical protein JKF63_00833 [Porcisia hertigi]
MLLRAWRAAPARKHLVSATYGSTRWIGDTSSATNEVSAQEYADRRRRFLDCLPDNSIVLLPAADESLYSHDILWPHRHDSLWYHLFGVCVPMRRQLAPPSSAITEDVQVTIAAFAKYMKGTATRTLLCVPPVTTDTSTLVWGSEEAGVSQYKRLLCSDDHAGGISRPGTHENVVTTNEVRTVCKALMSFITDMTQEQVKKWAEHGNLAPSTSLLESAEQLGRQLALTVMPRMFAAYPQQLRWDGRRYRVRQPTTSVALRKAIKAAHGPSVFHHPLEALFSTLSSTPLLVNLPRPLAFETTAKPGPQSSCGLIEVRYLAVAGYTPGLVSGTANAPPTRGSAPRTSRGRDPLVTITTPFENTDRELGVKMEVCLPVRRSNAYTWLYRQTKSPSQLRQHLRSARATEDAFLRIMQRAPATLSEHVLHCEFQRAVCDISARGGATAQARSAYIPVVASGVRGTEIHFTSNDGVATLGDVVRVDAGVEVDGVPTDCTRTLPIGSPHFPPSYVPLYKGLLQIQRKLLQRMGPGVTIGEVARMHMDETQALLCFLGVDIAQEAASSHEQRVPLALVRSCFCAHSFGHFFGLDIHEEPSSLPWPLTGTSEKKEVAREQRLSPRVLHGGMMHTVEPGVYMPSAQRAALFGLEKAHLPVVFHGGVGMQIEDDILILPSPNDEDINVCKDGVHRAQCPWSRGDYLQHALAAFHRYYDASGTGTTPSLLVSVCDAHITSIWAKSMTAEALNAVHFLFVQRVAFEGLSRAKASLITDLCTIQQQMFVPNPAYPDGPLVPEAGFSDWYPYSSIVLTATIPKDMELIEEVMRQ